MGGQRVATGDREVSTLAERRASMSWPQRLKRVFGFEIETCPACGGVVRNAACIEGPELIGEILTHLEANAVEPDASRWPPRGEMRASGVVVGWIQGLKRHSGPRLRTQSGLGLGIYPTATPPPWRRRNRYPCPGIEELEKVLRGSFYNFVAAR